MQDWSSWSRRCSSICRSRSISIFAGVGIVFAGARVVGVEDVVVFAGVGLVFAGAGVVLERLEEESFEYERLL